MDCCITEHRISMAQLSNLSSPEMYSDSETETEQMIEKVTTTPEKTTESILRSDNYLLARINKFLSGVPPPPKHTICRNDCSELLLRIYENHSYFWKELPKLDINDPLKSPDQSKENLCRNIPYQSLKNAPRNLSRAFDQCDVQNTSINSVLMVNNDDKVTQVSDDNPVLYCTVSEKEAKESTWPDVKQHKFHGLHYNRNSYTEEYENLTVKLCERYLGSETQSTCNIWFTKQGPGSARKRSLLAKRENGQSPGKRLSHLTRRRRTFSSANLQGLGLAEKKQLVLNIKKPYSKKGKSPRSSTKKKVSRRLTLDGQSPLKSKIETSKRALFQSPERAGPSKLYQSNPQTIKRALFPTPKKRDDDADRLKNDSRKRKNDDELEGPRLKWAKSLSFDCTNELYNNSVVSWTSKHSSSSLIETKPSFTPGRTELSDTHRKKLLWAVAEALRSKGIGMNHPKFKQYASNLGRTIKKFMPDLENRNIPRKPGSTSDRMLKLAKHHVLFIIETRPTD